MCVCVCVHTQTLGSTWGEESLQREYGVSKDAPASTEVVQRIINDFVMVYTWYTADEQLADGKSPPLAGGLLAFGSQGGAR